ncbi:MAG TPA: adenine deaminase [Firmicutes bacterium]|nr:adenine deaminase [Bacillota bacterium]
MAEWSCSRPLAEMTRDIVNAAMGREPADLVIKGGSLVNVHTGEIIPNTDVAAKYGRVVRVGDASDLVGESTRVISGEGFYLVPGFLDGHVHVESSMVTVTQFARAVLPAGTTGIFMDPHEIANVLGMEGVRLMIEEGRCLPLKVFATMPSCVPAAPGFEDAGAAFGPSEIAEAMKWEGIAGLGEMMNFPGVLSGDPSVHGEIQATLAAGKVVTGHYSIPEISKGLQAYAASGIISCHESTRREDALARLRYGMYAKLREGSAWLDVKATIKAITESRIDSRHAILVSDDVHPETLLTVGHLNHVVRRAIQEGLDPVRAIQMVTINTAECFGMARDLGSIAPGRYADILMLRDLAGVDVAKVIVDGELVAEDGRLLVELPRPEYPDFARHSVHLKKQLEPEDFVIRAEPGPVRPGGEGGAEGATVRVRAMGIIEGKVGTQNVVVSLSVGRDGTIPASVDLDVAKAAVVERHHATGSMGLGFVKGFGFKAGAVASTVAHDSHNLLIVGMNDRDMAYAGNVLAGCGGGMVAVRDGRVLALVELPVAGLLSDRPVEEVSEKVKALSRAWQELGCHLVSPFMTMALLSLPVLPELRLTNRGLVDTLAFKFVSAVV